MCQMLQPEKTAITRSRSNSSRLIRRTLQSLGAICFLNSESASLRVKDQTRVVGFLERRKCGDQWGCGEISLSDFLGAHSVGNERRHRQRQAGGLSNSQSLAGHAGVPTDATTTIAIDLSP